jgi:hypothetical protein
VCWSYYQEIGFVRGDPSCLGPDGMIASRFNLHAVERTLADHQHCVIDLGAGHSVYRDEASLVQLEHALTPYPNVFLLLPSPDLDQSSAILRARNVNNDWLLGFTVEHGYDPNEHFLRHASNFRLAKFIVYTEGKSPEETRDEILSLLNCQPERTRPVGMTLQQEEMIRKLEDALQAAQEGALRSLILVTMRTDGRCDCWTRLRSEQDSRAAREFIQGLSQDLAADNAGQ